MFPGLPSLLRSPLYTSALEIFLKCTSHHADPSRSLPASQEPSGQRPRSFRGTLRGSCPATPLRPFTEAKRAYVPRPSWLLHAPGLPCPSPWPDMPPHTCPENSLSSLKPRSVIVTSSSHVPQTPLPLAQCMKTTDCFLLGSTVPPHLGPAFVAPLIAYSNDLGAPQASPPLE